MLSPLARKVSGVVKLTPARGGEPALPGTADLSDMVLLLKVTRTSYINVIVVASDGVRSDHRRCTEKTARVGPTHRDAPSLSLPGSQHEDRAS